MKVCMTEATCPKCNGSTRRPMSENARKYADIIAGYRATDDTLPCDNCGGQTMSLTATGTTRVDPATGLGCLHNYQGRKAGNCYYVYTCVKCASHYDIDSGD
jgi:hypothetical protein